MQRVRVLLLTPRLGGGGAQHVMALLAGELSREKYEVHLGLLTTADAEATALPQWVTVHALGAGRTRTRAIQLLRLVWRVRPAVILSGAAEANFLTLLLRPFFPLRTAVLVRQNGTVSSALAHGDLPRYTRVLYRLLYPRADRVICQSRAMAEDLGRELNMGEKQIAVLPNPVDINGIRAAMNAPSKRHGLGPHLLAVGRLSHEKGFDLLLEAMVSVRERFPHADLIIAGTGKEEEALKRQCRALHLESTVSFIGYVDRIYEFFPGTTLFVLSSRYEGMPNSLLEAAAAELPLVATPASEGIRDLLRGRRGTWLADEISAEALAATIVTALEEIRPGERFGHGFFPAVKERPEQIAGWGSQSAKTGTMSD